MLVLFSIGLAFIVSNIKCQPPGSLVFSMPGFLTQLYSGLYGGRVDPASNGSEGNLYEMGFNSGYMKGAFQTGFRTISQSYDPVSKNILMNINLLDLSKLTLVKGSLCIGKPQSFHYQVIKYAELTSPAGSADLFRSSVDNGIIAVAYYNTKVYLILNAVYGNWTSGTTKVELRSLEGCESQMKALAIIFGYKFNLVGCSKLIATIEQRKYRGESNFRSGTDLKVFDISGRLTFFTIVIDYKRTSTNQSIDVLLYMITDMGIKTAIKVLLHRQPLKSKYIVSVVDHWGGVDYKDGVLCWSTLSQIHCGKLDIANNKLTNITTVVKEGEPQSYGICKVAHVQSYYANVTTGVAIVNVSQAQYSVYFGCFAQMLDLGGAGLVKIKSDGNERYLYPVTNVKNKEKTVLAGGMFNIKDPIQPCGTAPAPAPGSTSRNIISPLLSLFICVHCMILSFE